MTREKWLATANVAFTTFFTLIGSRYMYGADIAQAAIEAAVVTLFSCIAYVLIRRATLVVELAYKATIFGPLNDDRVLGILMATTLAVTAGCAIIGWLFAGVFTVVFYNFVYGWAASISALYAVSDNEREATKRFPDVPKGK